MKMAEISSINTKNTSVISRNNFNKQNSNNQKAEIEKNKLDKDVSDFLEEDKQKLEEDIKKLNETVDLVNDEVNEQLKFKLHEKSERMMVQVMNLKKNEVVREIPAEEVLDLIGKIKEMVGVFLDEKV